MTWRRGDIVLVDFGPARATEAGKICPSVIVTNDQANQYGTNVMSVGKGRVGKRVGRLPPSLMSALNERLKLHLDL